MLLVKLTGTKDFNKLLTDIHENPLLSTNHSNFEIPTMPNPADIIGSHIYEKFHSILKPIACLAYYFLIWIGRDLQLFPRNDKKLP